MTQTRDHGGGLDAAILRYGGTRRDWLDLSTGINPVAYPLPQFDPLSWTALPDADAVDRLEQAARVFWNVPAGAAVLAAPGASALIARMPDLVTGQHVHIPGPTYNEHAAAFLRTGRTVVEDTGAPIHIYVHPNNPDGRLWDASVIEDRELTVVDESFCDVLPTQSHIERATQKGVVILKSFGKFWGLAGVRLGFAIGDPDLIAQLREMIGPWPVAGPALHIGAQALSDQEWTESTRTRLKSDAAKLDSLMANAGAGYVGGTDLFRLYDVGDAAAWQDRLAKSHIWSRIFPYSKNWLRLGLPCPDGWARLKAVL